MGAPSTMGIESAAVIGAGIMGAGIAQVFAAAGLQVNLLDINDDATAKGMNVVAKNLEKLVGKKKLSEADAAATLGRIKPTTDYADLATSDLILEVVSENFELKKKIFGMVDKVAKPSAIIGSNT